MILFTYKETGLKYAVLQGGNHSISFNKCRL